MARIHPETPEYRAAWDAWLASKAGIEPLLASARSHPPWLLYRHRPSGHRVGIVGYDYGGTVTIVLSGLYNLLFREGLVRDVFVGELEECDLPGPDERVGVLFGQVGDAVAHIQGDDHDTVIVNRKRGDPPRVLH